MLKELGQGQTELVAYVARYLAVSSALLSFQLRTSLSSTDDPQGIDLGLNLEILFARGQEVIWVVMESAREKKYPAID